LELLGAGAGAEVEDVDAAPRFTPPW